MPDNVAVALADDLHKGETVEVDGVGVTLRDDIARGHKFALRDIAAGENVVKYGYPIGHATEDIPQGGWIHSHNLKTNLRDDLEYTYAPKVYDVAYPRRDAKVMGYLRKNGAMGIRNELWIVPSVGCVNGQAQAIAERVKRECDCSHLDDVRVYTHNYGCSQLGDDHANTQKALAALVKHPNAGRRAGAGPRVREQPGVGPEGGDRRVGRRAGEILIAQEVEDEIEAGFEICRGLVEKTKSDKRQPLPLSYLKVGLKCGGFGQFFGHHGQSAGGVVLRLADRAGGGTTVLTEVPRCSAPKTILMDRAADRTVFDETVCLINDFKHYFRKFDQPIYGEPFAGQQEGRHHDARREVVGMRAEGRGAARRRCAELRPARHETGAEPLAGSGQRPGGRFGAGLVGLPAGALHHGARHAVQAFVPTMKISTNTRLSEFKAIGSTSTPERWSRTRSRRPCWSASSTRCWRRRRRAPEARKDGFQGDRHLQDGRNALTAPCCVRRY